MSIRFCFFLNVSAQNGAAKKLSPLSTKICRLPRGFVMARGALFALGLVLRHR